MKKYFCLIFLPLLLLVSCKTKEKAKDKAPVVIISDGVPIAYTDAGKSDTTLLFIHGWCINKEYWQPQVDHFKNRYRVVTVDLPGFGQSGSNRQAWSFEAYTAGIKKIIETLQLKNVVLIGHSMSGDIILDADNKYPELLAGIVGVDNLHVPAGPYSAEAQKEIAIFFQRMPLAFDSTVETMRAGLFHSSTDTAIVKRVMNDIRKTGAQTATGVLQANAEMAQNEQKLMQGLQHPLFLVNSDVFKVNADSLGKYCAKGFGVELVPSTGHYPMIEKPALFNASLQKALDRMGK